MNLESVKYLLGDIKKKRGYTLPYHEHYSILDLNLLENYDRFYENLTLKTRYLDDRAKELVWLGILISVYEKEGTIHVKRAKDAGVTKSEIHDLIILTQLASGINSILFIEKYWADEMLNVNPLKIYKKYIDQFTKESMLENWIIELILIGIYSATSNEIALNIHLKRAAEMQIKGEKILETISFIILPCGGPTLIAASKTLKESVMKGWLDRKSTRLNSSHVAISYAVFCLKKKI